MEIWLYDFIKKEDIKVDLKIESTYPVVDLYMLSYSKDESTTLFNKSDSEPYDSYMFRKMLSITKGNFVYEGKKEFCTIGDYLKDDGKIESFVINSNNEIGTIRFETAHCGNDYVFDNYTIFNYSEYCQIKNFFQEKAISFKEFIIAKINKTIDYNDFMRYSIPPKENNQFVSQSALNFFLDEQEKK